VIAVGGKEQRHDRNDAEGSQGGTRYRSRSHQRNTHPSRNRQNSIQLKRRAVPLVIARTPHSLCAATVDAHHRIIGWTPGAEALFGYSGQEAIGRFATAIIKPLDRDEQRSRIDAVLAGEHLGSYEALRLHRDGRVLKILVSPSPLRDESSIVGVSSTYRLRSDQRPPR
jgi:PAS domain S-box-containing protein